METNEIIDLVLAQLNEDEMWFTTKNDPTIEDAKSYYELDEYGDLTDKSKEKIAKEVESYIGDGAILIADAISMWIEEALCEYTIDYTDNLKTVFKDKPVVEQIEAFEMKTESKLEESNLKRLREATQNSLDEINAKIESEDFDAESNEGKLILKTKELFEKLTGLGYQLQVSLDNGESETSILLGDQGGKVIITINDVSKPIRAFANGNFELTDANIEVLENIKDNLE